MSALLELREARSIKRRRSTKADLALLDNHLVRISEREAPCSARRIYYAGETEGLFPKDDREYARVLSRLVKLRRAGRIPWDAILDEGRWVQRENFWTSFAEFREESRSWFRLDRWAGQETQLWIFTEKLGYLDVFTKMANPFGVPATFVKGYSGHKHLRDIAETIADDLRPCRIYWLGDHDPSGRDAERFAVETIKEYVAELSPRRTQDVEVTRLAVTAIQYRQLQGLSRETKATDTRTKAFKEWCGSVGLDGRSLEMDALPTERLRGLVEKAILSNIDRATYTAVLAREAAERGVAS